MKELGTMLKAGLGDFGTTASLVPSSERLVRAMVRPLPLGRARCVVEFGPGTGRITAELLKGMAPSARLLAFEVNRRLAVFTRDRLRDPRLEMITRGAEELGEVLRSKRIPGVDVVVSSLGLTFMPDRLRHRVLDEASGALRPEGTLTQYVYLHGTAVPFRKFDGEFRRFPAETFLRSRFGEVRRRRVLRNIPPAFVFTCQRPR